MIDAIDNNFKKKKGLVKRLLSSIK